MRLQLQHVAGVSVAQRGGTQNDVGGESQIHKMVWKEYSVPTRTLTPCGAMTWTPFVMAVTIPRVNREYSSLMVLLPSFLFGFGVVFSGTAATMVRRVRTGWECVSMTASERGA